MNVRVKISFNGLRRGQVAVVDGRNGLVKGYIGLGLLEVLDDGEGTSGPGGSAQGDPGRIDGRAEDRGPDGGEPGQGAGSR